jgi:hypothetical protein
MPTGELQIGDGSMMKNRQKFSTESSWVALHLALGLFITAGMQMNFEIESACQK